MSPPAVGITAALERARWGPWDQLATLVPRSYSSAVQRAGGTAWLMPPDRAAPDDPDQWLDRIDALVLMGGADVVPAAYGAEADPRTGEVWPDRDNFEVTIARRASDRGKPVLGICRGMQILNVALGGTLVQHVPDVVGSDAHRVTPGTFAEHDVRLQAGSLAARAVGSERPTVKSHHHQGVDALGEGLVASGWSEPDEIVEAIELPGHPFALGVLWHPEEDERSRVIGALVEAARARTEVPTK
jgi:putative glutamine amidotransferase